MLRIFFVLFLCIGLFGIAQSESKPVCGSIGRTVEIQIKEYRIRAELALSEQEKTCGLAFRDSLPEDHGMLFVFANKQPLIFWMKDTKIPLSIAFLGDDGAILNLLEMRAMDSSTLHRSVAPSRYALEMRAQWFEDHQIRPGDRVLFDLSAAQD